MMSTTNLTIPLANDLMRHRYGDAWYLVTDTKHLGFGAWEITIICLRDRVCDTVTFYKTLDTNWSIYREGIKAR